MKINLPLNSFSFFKVVSGSLFLYFALFYPIASITYLIMMAIGRAHAFGAWFAMWRANKLNWFYGVSVLVIAVTASFVGVRVFSLEYLLFFTYLLFVFHYLFDEFDLQEEKRSISNVISIASVSFIAPTYLISYFYNFKIDFNFFLGFFLVLLSLEIFFIKEINWFFIHTKILSFFVLLGIFLKVSPFSIVNMFLLLHYLFWFIYPVYKINKYKKEDLPGFVIILLFLIFSSVVSSNLFLDMSGISYSKDVVETALRAFLIGTIIHILSTAPFGYLIGLPKPKYVP